MLDHKKEKSMYLNQFLDDTFFNKWRVENKNKSSNTMYSNLELIITPDCNLACTYCYVNKNANGLYPKDIRNHDHIRQNTEMLIDWLIEQRMVPRNIEIFSGSVFSQKVGWDVLYILYEKYKKAEEDLRPSSIIIPTNFTFLIDEETTKKVEDIIEKFKDIGIRFFLSGSVEGKYMEQNRPFKRNLKLGDGSNEHVFIPNCREPRDDDYYERAFSFCKKYGYGFHPMVYSKGIDLWKKNFVWFQEMFKKHDLKFNSFMLLEVRNEEWTSSEAMELAEFTEFAVDYIFKEVFKENKAEFLKALRQTKILNTLFDSCVGENITTGITCSIQNAMYVRMGDLHIVPCHRTSYTGLEYGRFITEGSKITGIEGINVELMTQILSFNHKTLPMCETCVIKEVCNQTCLGSNLETTGDMFAPNPSVCRLQYARVIGVIKVLKKLGLYDEVVNSINRNIQMSYWLLENKIMGGETNGE